MTNVVVSLEDVALERDDILSLEPRTFLSDKVLIFCGALLHRDVLGSNELVLFVHPNVMFLVTNIPPPLGEEILKPLHFPSKRVIFVPCPNEDGDSHWSLLVFVRPLGTAFHFDSAGGFNRFNAKRIVDAVSSGCRESWSFEHVVRSPVQDNSYDCGVFVVEFMEFFSRRIATNPIFLVEPASENEKENLTSACRTIFGDLDALNEEVSVNSVRSRRGLIMGDIEREIQRVRSRNSS